MQRIEDGALVLESNFFDFVEMIQQTLDSFHSLFHEKELGVKMNVSSIDEYMMKRHRHDDDDDDSDDDDDDKKSNDEYE